MKHYHGTPVGGKAHAAAEFIEGRLVLIPWKRPDDLARAMECSQGFIVDNSAFTFWGSGERPDWREYAGWVQSFARHPRFEWCIIPDVIDGGEKENNDLLARWWKWIGDDRRGVVPTSAPVWHLHESIERLQKLCRLYRIVCIGSSGDYATPGVGRWWDRMDEAFTAIVDSDGYPVAKIHGLRMLRSDIVERYPFYSCDSTNAAQNGSRESNKSGVDALWGSLTLARRIESVQSPSTFEVRESVNSELFELKGESR